MNKHSFYVEVFRPAYPQRGICHRVMRAKDFSRDCLNPGMTALFRVDCVTTKQEAISCVLEYAAGKRSGLCVYPCS